jgi:hypothetical protein
MAGWRRDLAYVMRRLVGAPGIVAAVVVSIGIGIAANATIFAMVSRFVLRAAPVGDPATLVSLHLTHEGEGCCNSLPYPVYVDLRDQAKSFSGVAAFDPLIPASINGKGDPERVWGQATTTNYFEVAQLGMTLGRGFRADEDHAQVIVLGHRLWQRRFAGDPEIVGKAITLSGKSFTVVGIAPAGYRGIDFVLDPEFWVPLGNGRALNPTEPPREARDYHWLEVIARFKPGVTHEQADAELATLAGRFATAYPATDKGNGFRYEQAGSLPPRNRAEILTFLAALSIVVLLVLCIAGANVANLLLAQAAERSKEMAVRLTLGASRGALQRLMLMESVILAVGDAGVVGVSFAGTDSARSQSPCGLARVALHVCAERGSGRVSGDRAGVGGIAPDFVERVEGWERTRGAAAAVEFAQRARGLAGGDVGGAAVRDGTVFAGDAARVGNRYWISSARRVDYRSRSAGERVFGGADRPVSEAAAGTRCCVAGRVGRGLHGYGAAVGRRTERWIQRCG